MAQAGHRLLHLHPDVDDPAQQVAFGTSGHRGSAADAAFNDDHIAATTQAICDYRKAQGYDGPLFMGRDTHALSEPAHATALEVLAANGVLTLVDSVGGYVPTPAVSLAILEHNATGTGGTADGIVITPSHNPPRDGGFKYNPPNGGPADTDVTKWIQDRANAILRAGGEGVARIPYARAAAADTTQPYEFKRRYVEALSTVLHMDAIKEVKIGADPSAARVWPTGRPSPITTT